MGLCQLMKVTEVKKHLPIKEKATGHYNSIYKETLDETLSIKYYLQFTSVLTLELANIIKTGQ